MIQLIIEIRGMNPGLLKTVIIAMLTIPCIAFSQQDALFTQYMYNKLEFNPAYAGSHEVLSMDVLGRFQWVGIQGAPRTLCFTIHTPLPYNHIGIGLYAYQDELGPTIDYNLMGSFAYRIIFPDSKLCFGISAGIKYYDINWSALNPKDPSDPALSDQVKNKVVPDVDFGIYYYGNKFYVGTSVKHLLQNQMVVSSALPDVETNFTRLLRTYYGIAGGTIRISDNFMILPSALIKYMHNASPQADFNVRFRMISILTLGVSYRTEDAIGLMMEIGIYKGLSLGYSYDIWYNALESMNKGSHEIRIGYDLDLFHKDRMLSPRYF